MRKMKRILSILLALMLLVGASALGEPAEAIPVPAIYSHDGRVTFIDGACVSGPIDGFEGAADVVASVLDRLGGDARTVLDPWRTLTDAYGNRYYVFQQMCNDTTVLGGAVKVITDAEGGMLGLTSSIVSELPEAVDAEAITAEAAERVVLDHEAGARGQALTVAEGLTEKMILPITLEIDMEAEDDSGSRYVWVVYTDNPDSRLGQSSDLPYLAHYVTLSGEYLYALPTVIPGDEAGESGFDASYVFEFMEPVEYTGYVDLSTGGEWELTVTVMRDKRTGMYYLGDPERRIVVADCYEFLYGGGKVVLESSRDNLQWDQVGLMSLYNYCRAYDYYKEIGWSGGDGLDTPILILNNYCDANRKPVDNAAYVGQYLGWQIFLASQANDYSQCLDVLAHEYTHCVTGSVMTYNAYMNDYGAINEAVSDIQGKTCALLSEDGAEPSWLLGDRSRKAVRSMDDPQRFEQPEFTWDLFYTPNVKKPTVLNDEGGVHTNSSLLNHLAWMLYDQGGMTLEEGRAFWFTVDCAMVPGTDYPQLAELLPWALEVAGLERYADALKGALEATRLGANAQPERFDPNRALISLTLPDNEIFDDGEWIMVVYTFNPGNLLSGIMDIAAQLLSGDTSALPPTLQSVIDAAGQALEEARAPGYEGKTPIALVLDKVFGEYPQLDGAALLDDLKAELVDWAKSRFREAFYYAPTNMGQDGHLMRLVGIPGYAMPMLIHGVYNEAISDLEDVSTLFCIGHRWVDLRPAPKGDAAEDGNDPLTALLDDLVKRAETLTDFSQIPGLFFCEIEGGRINELPTDGLEDIRPAITDTFGGLLDDDIEAEPRLSRPKVDEVPDAA